MMKKIESAVVCCVVGAWAWVCAAGEISNGTCFARWTETTLTVGNAAFTRVFVADRGLRTRSWKAGATEWIDSARAPKAGKKMSVQAEKGRWSLVGEAGVKVVATVDGQPETLWILPDMSGVLRESAVRADTSYKVSGNEYSDLYRQADAYRRASDTLPLAPLHVSVTAVELVDQTDMHNELYHEKNWLLMVREAPLILSSPVVVLENSFTGEGVLSVRLAPLPKMRPEPFPDVVACANDNKTIFASVRNGYPVAELAYAGGRTGRIRALRDFQRALRAYRAGRDGIFLTNTWGDSNRDARINADFMMAEVKAGGELGVDVIQIDDGWQKGKSANSALLKKRAQGAWGNFRAIDPNFWAPDPVRFPQGLKPIVDAARERHLGFGLWFGPDSSNDCGSWNEDAQTLLDFYKTLGVKYFKIDSLKMHSRLAIENQRKMFDRMLAESNGEMTFDLDVTGMARRPGYLGMPDIGPLFVENRYWKDGRYWPHQTLRNVWSLAQVLDPIRLRMEVLNPRHGEDQYPESPLAPRHWRGDTLFALVMVASPLGWFEISELSPATVAEMKPLVARWKQERANLHGGFTVPVASVPDGIAWTGFVTQGADGAGGYALFFREMNDAPAFDFDLKELLPQAEKVEVIGGRGTAKLAGTVLSVAVPEKLDYVWVKVRNRSQQLFRPSARGFDFPAEVQKGHVRLVGGVYTNAAAAARQTSVGSDGWHLAFDRDQMAPSPNWCTISLLEPLSPGDWMGRTVRLVMRRRPFRNVTKQMAINFTDRDGETFQFLPDTIEDDVVANEITCRFKIGPARFSGCWGGGAKANKQMDLPIRFTSLNGHFASPTGKGEMTLVRVDVETPPTETARTVAFHEPISVDTTYPGARPFPAADELTFHLVKPFTGKAQLLLYANSRGSSTQGEPLTFSASSSEPTQDLHFKVDLPVDGQYEFGRLTGPEPLTVVRAEGLFRQSAAETLRLDVETGNRLHIVRTECANERPVVTISNPTQQTRKWKVDLRFQDVFGHAFSIPFDRSVAAGETVRVPVPQPLPAKGLWFVRAVVEGEDGSKARPETRFAWIDYQERTPFVEKPKFRCGIHYHGTHYLPDLVDPTIDAMVAAGAKFTRTDYSFMFTDIFPTEAAVADPSKRNWAAADDLLKRMRAAGLSLEIIIGGTPAWAADPAQYNACKGLRRLGCIPSRPGLFKTFCQAFAERYGKQIDYYEIGNEWDIVPKPVLSIDDALRMQREAYEGVHAGCPDACVTPNGWAHVSSRSLLDGNYSTGMIEAFARHPELYDAWSLHCHGPFEGYVSSLQKDFFPMRAETGLQTRPWISGETAQTTFGGDEVLVGKTVWAKILYAWAWGARDYIWYNLRATGWLEGGEPGYGLLTASLHPRAGYASFAALTSIFQGLDADGRLISTNDVSLFRFKGEKDGFKGIVLAGWNWKSENSRSIRIKTDAVSASRSDYMGNRRPMSLVQGELILDLTDDPQAVLLPGATFAVLAEPFTR